MSTEKDQWDEMAEDLLIQFPNGWSPSCQEVLDAVAAKLREMGEEKSKFMRKYHDAMTIMSEWQNIESAAAVAEAQLLRPKIDELRAEIEKLKAEKLAEAERVTGFINEVIVWTPRGGHTLGCNCGAYWCERRKEILEAEQAKEREE